eukprot:3278264-Pleurochrysis_carterae.AAC.1
MRKDKADKADKKPINVEKEEKSPSPPSVATPRGPFFLFRPSSRLRTDTLRMSRIPCYTDTFNQCTGHFLFCADIISCSS